VPNAQRVLQHIRFCQGLLPSCMLMTALRLSCGPRSHWYLQQDLTLATLSATGLLSAVLSCTLSRSSPPGTGHTARPPMMYGPVSLSRPRVNEGSILDRL
jgi:hypothetical protein